MLIINKAKGEVCNRFLIRDTSYLEKGHLKAVGLIYIIETKNLRKMLPLGLTLRISPEDSLDPIFIIIFVFNEILQTI